MLKIIPLDIKDLPEEIENQIREAVAAALIAERKRIGAYLSKVTYESYDKGRLRVEKAIGVLERGESIEGEK